jgi:hypothetical protein
VNLSCSPRVVPNMNHTRHLSIILLLLLAGTAAPRLRADDATCTNTPKTKLEALACQTGLVLYKGIGDIGSLPVERGTITVFCLNYLAPDARQHEAGLDIRIKLTEGAFHTLVDYDEIDHLLQALSALGKADKKTAGLPSFMAVYKTRDELRVATYNIVDGGTESIAASIGRAGCPTVSLTLNQLAQLAAIIGQAKTALDTGRIEPRPKP